MDDKMIFITIESAKVFFLIYSANKKKFPPFMSTSFTVSDGSFSLYTEWVMIIWKYECTPDQALDGF